ncbi:MAG TPA: class I adenylate-forming enzyme family protein [Vulgatibacteraceae bacterium]|nr:class I adenylate-forming enzyme family protein [Vulgatibacteraceae bacterium]
MFGIAVADQLRLNAQAFPDRTAIEVIGGPSLTYAEAWRRVLGLAETLREVPVHNGHRMVGLLLPNGADAILGMLACQLAGCSAVPINSRLARPEMNYILQDSGAVTVLAAAPYLDVAADLEGRAPLRVIDCDAVPSREAPAADWDPVDGATPYVVTYTSGTTGFPKGVVCSGDYIFMQYMRWAWQFGFGRHDTLLTAGPLFHGSYNGLSVIALLMGAKNRVMTAFDPAVACDELAERATFAFLVPTMTSTVLEEWRARGRPELGSLRFLLSSGASITPELLEGALSAFPNATVAEAYGYSEVGWVTYEEKPSPRDIRPQCVGWPMVGAEIAVVRPDGGRCEVGEPGEVVARSMLLFDGYLNKPEATEAAMVDGMVVSGDIGVLDEDGRLRIVDRKAHMIVTGGENVYTAEVERVLLTHPKIAEAAVVGRPDPHWGEAVVAVVVPAADGLDPEDVRNHCRRELAGYKVPKVVEIRSELPRNSMGKVQKFALREPSGAPSPAH